MNILVTGSNGQLGSEIKHFGEIANSGNTTFFYTDVEDLDITNLVAVNQFVSVNKIDCIINAAAYTNVDGAETDRNGAFAVNAEGPKVLASVSATNKLKFIHVSTDYVFDGSKNTPYIETDPVMPKSVYGESKLQGEMYVSEVCPKSIIIRTAWLYSVYGNNFVKTILKLATERKTQGLSVVYDQVGAPTNARDLARAIIGMVKGWERGEAYKTGIYHYAAAGVCSWYDVAVEIARVAKLPTPISCVTTDEFPRPAPRPAYSVLSTQKIQTDYDVDVRYWRNSVRDCVTELLEDESIFGNL